MKLNIKVCITNYIYIIMADCLIEREKKIKTNNQFPFSIKH